MTSYNEKQLGSLITAIKEQIAGIKSFNLCNLT